MSKIITRRNMLIMGSAGLLGGCDALNSSAGFRKILTSVERGNFAIQRSLGDRMELAREYRLDQRSPVFRANGSQSGSGPAYAASAAQGFADWNLAITGLVERPQAFSMAALQAMPQREQITRHDCVEGWSAIGKWTGVPLKPLLDLAKPKDNARYLVFRCADILSGRPYYESIDMLDAYHPQTILAHRLNDAALPIANGAPLRLRVERQLGYKQAKYVQAIEAVASLDGIGEGKGGHWEDVAGYQWYAGI